jgi:hypothetical protein
VTAEVSPPFILVAPPRAEIPAIGRRRHAPPPPPAISRVDAVLNRVVASRALWLSPILLLQAILCFRLSNGLEEDEAMSINAGHQMIAHLLHGTPAPAFGSYFAGVPAVYAVPAAMLDHVGGPGLVRGVNTLLVLAATVLVYLASRRMFGQGTAILAAAVFAINPATIFVSRFASEDAPALLLLATAAWAASRATQRALFPLLTGIALATAVAQKYVVVLFVPGVLLLSLALGTQRSGVRRAGRAVGLAAAATVGCLAAWAGIAHRDWAGFAGTSLGGHTISHVAGTTLLSDAWHYIGLIAVAGLVTIAIVPGRRALPAALCAAGLLPVVVEIASGQPASLQRNVGLSMVFLAPVLGLLGTRLVGQGRLLGLRAPLAVVGAVALLSSGMGTSASMIHGWPTSTSIDSALRYYVHRGPDRYLVDGSDLPAYYLSDVTGYDQWTSTLDAGFASPGGNERLNEALQSGNFRLVLYRNNGATPSLDKSMLATLRTRYTLVARVPVSPDNTDAYWSLWLSELPR